MKITTSYININTEYGLIYIYRCKDIITLITNIGAYYKTRYLYSALSLNDIKICIRTCYLEEYQTNSNKYLNM